MDFGTSRASTTSVTSSLVTMVRRCKRPANQSPVHGSSVPSCFNPQYGVRIGAEHGEEKLLALYSEMGRALARFSGWRAACFVANPHFAEAFAHAAIMAKPASNAKLRDTFLVFQL
jgi:23S rRNA G2445 N2-methylase RlmL